MAVSDTWAREPLVKARMLLQGTLDIQTYFEHLEDRTRQGLEEQLKSSLRSQAASRAYARIFETASPAYIPAPAPPVPRQHREQPKQAVSKDRDKPFAWIRVTMARVCKPLVPAGRPKGKHERGSFA